MITVKWGNDLGLLAQAMFGGMAGNRIPAPEQVFQRRSCVVVPNRTVQYWLLHEFLYRDRDEAQPRVLANCDFPLLNVFVNDWLHRMDPSAVDERDPAAHPFSTESLQWRIHRILGSPELAADGRFASLAAYLQSTRDNPQQSARRRFLLAGRLASLFDEYVVYRPETVASWEEAGEEVAEAPAGLPAHLQWQPALWRLLTANGLRDQTYLAAFRRMEARLPRCGIESRYDRIHVFGASMMPRVYAVFFHILSEILPVEVFMFNPCRDLWLEQPTPRQRERRQLRLEGDEDAAGLFAAGNPILATNGRGCSDLLVELLDLTDGQAEAGAVFRDPGEGTVLRAVQSAILRNRPVVGGANRADGSVQVHVCHSPMREVEALQDHLLQWFAEIPGLQPRQIQVQVSDMATYSPYIDAVLAAPGRGAEEVIPYVIADRIRGGESVVAEAFKRLMELGDSRFPASDVLELLQCGSVRDAFGLDEADVSAVGGWLDAAGVRWGWDAAHRRRAVGVDFTAATTWRNGLDRLLLGYAMGSGTPTPPGPPRAGADEWPLPCDCVEGDDAQALGRFMRFMDSLVQVAGICREDRTPADWADRLDEFVNTFFAGSDDTYRDVGVLRGAIQALRTSAAAAGLGPGDTAPVTVVREILNAHLEGVIGGEDLVSNAVVFSALRTGSALPRRIMCLLGMGDGLFPRVGNRPAYDLFRIQRRRGDRSQRIEDRMAFLEAVSGARERLYISYTGRSIEDDREIPPSVLVKELVEAIAGDGRIPRHVQVCHRLQAFHPAYFQGQEGLFSYSQADCDAARVRAGQARGPAPGGPSAPADTAPETAPETAPDTLAIAPAPAPGIELEAMIQFFRNPAAVYYRDILGVRLDVESDGAPGDSEEFEVGYLTAHRVNAVVIRSILSQPPPDQEVVYRELAQQGLVRLGQWGRTGFEEQWADIEAFLQAPREALGGSLADALAAQEELTDEFCTYEAGGGITLSGRLRRRPDAAAAFTWVDFRYAKPKAANRIESWIRHLFACAQGLAETRGCVQGKRGSRKDEVEVIVFSPVSRREAVSGLKPFIEAYRAGFQRALAFAPETSTAYASAHRKEPRAKGGRPAVADAAPGGISNGDPRVERGLAAAHKAWKSTDYHRGEDSDTCLATEFGEAGPASRMPEFGEWALALAGPMLAAAEAEGETPGVTAKASAEESSREATHG